MGPKAKALLIAYTISVLGDWAFKIAIPVIIYRLTSSPVLMAAAFACSFAPYVLIMPIGGALADAMRRQRILYLGDFASGVMASALCFYLNTGGHNAYYILPAMLGLGTVSSIYHPAFQGFIPNVVGTEALPRANAYFTAFDNALSFMGPVIAGALISVFDPNIILYLNAVSFLLSALLIFQITPDMPENWNNAPITLTRLKHDLWQGANVVWDDPILRWGTIMFVGENFATNMILGNEIFFLTEVLGLSVSLAGTVMGLSASAAIAGSLAGPWLIRRFMPGQIIVAFIPLIAIGTCTLLLGTSYGPIPVILGRGIVMASRAIIIVTMFTYRQRATPREQLSRVVAIQRTISYIAVPLAALGGGEILSITHKNMNIVIMISTFVLVMSTIVGVFSPIRSQNLKLNRKKGQEVQA